MKLKKLFLLMILQLLSYSIGYCQNNPPFTGEETVNNSGIFVSIDTIKIINTKLIERKYLLEENIQLDSIILDLNKVIEHTENKYNIVYDEYLKTKELNDNINNKLNKRKILDGVLIGSTFISIAALIIVCLTK